MQKGYWETDNNKRRSSWFTNREGIPGYIRASLIKAMGYQEDNLDKPIIGIINSWSELNPGHYHLREVGEAVKRGVWQSGGFPLELNVSSVCEPFLDKSSLIYRNLMAMETEEMMKTHPFDGLVILTTCDKNVPAYLMAAASLDIPTIFVMGGSMPPGKFKGERVTSATAYYKYFAEYEAGNISLEELDELKDVICPGIGACGMMGTANTMQCMGEALGMTLPRCGTIPAASGAKYEIAEKTGRKIMELVAADITPSQIMTEKAFENAIRILMAIGGSTNAVIHVTAVARRCGINLDLNKFDQISRTTPFICNIQPSGIFGVTELDQAGGVPAVMKELEDILHTDLLTVTNNSLKKNLDGVKIKDREIIKSKDNPISDTGALAVIKGNLCPNGAIIKTSAASPELMKHKGPAFVIESIEEGHEKLWDKDAEITKDHIIVFRNQGPIGGPGMPEYGNIDLPEKLLKEGVRDMVRITDSRMSGSAYGTVILHMDPESAVGGPLAIVEDGDMIEFDFEARSLNLLISDEEMKQRIKEVEKIVPEVDRGYMKLYYQHIMQASAGCDFDFL